MNKPLPTIEELLLELKELPGFQSVIDNVPDEQERRMLEESVMALMRSYYASILQPFAAESSGRTT